MDSDHGRETGGDAGQETISMWCLSTTIGPSPEGLWTLRSSSTRPFPPPDILHRPCRPFPSARLDNLRFPQPANTGFPSNLSSVLRGTSWRRQLLAQDSFLRLQTVAYLALLFSPNFGTISGACVESHDEPLHEADGCDNGATRECNEGYV